MIMDIKQAKNISIVKFLERKLGIKGVKYNKDNIMFPAIYCNDDTPALSVNPCNNSFFDFINKKKGDIIDLVRLLYKCSKNDALIRINNIIGNDYHHYLFKDQPQKNDNNIKIIEDKNIFYYPIQSYIEDIKKICLKTAKKYLKEIHYSINKTKFFGVGIKNINFNYHISRYDNKNNRSITDIAGIEDIIFIKGKKINTDSLMIFEDYFDFLTLLTKNKQSHLQNDVIIISSIKLTVKLIQYINNNLQYDNILCYLQNNIESERLLNKIKLYDYSKKLKIIDKSYEYARFESINQYWIEYKSKESI